MNLDQFIASLIVAVPELASAVRQHVVDCDVVLPHVFMGDVTRWATAAPEDAPRTRLFAAFEQALDSGSDDVAELLNVSFLENLDLADGTPRLFAAFGPRLAAEWARRVSALDADGVLAPRQD